MKAFIESGMESGTVTNTRSRLFKPIANYQEILNELESCYDPNVLGTADKLFWLVSESPDGIVLVVNDHLMSHNYMADADLDGMVEFMKGNGNSDSVIEFMKLHLEEMCAGDIIELIAQPGQKITVQIYDAEFGTEEYELNS